MAASKSKQDASIDAIQLLIDDHKKVQRLFKDYEKLEDDAYQEKQALVGEICTELTIHAQIEEEIFYPAFREAVGDDDLADEAVVEHAGAKDLIAQLQAMSPEDDLYDAKVTVLGEYINHHIKEEQDEMFPEAKKAKLNELGEQLMQRKLELLGEFGLEEEASEISEQLDAAHQAAQTKTTSRRSSAASK